MRGKVLQAGLEEQVEIDSAGTAAYHIGSGPDPRTVEAALRRGYDLSKLRARKAVAQDFERFEYVLAMDQSNYDNLKAICPPGSESKLGLFLDYAKNFEEREVPDPYYSGADGFELVLDMVEDGCEGLLETIRSSIPAPDRAP